MENKTVLFSREDFERRARETPRWKRAYYACWRALDRIRHIPNRVEQLAFSIRHGYRYEESWYLDTALARWVAPRLRYLAEHHCGHPTYFCGASDPYSEHCDVDGCDEIWTAILYKIAEGFELIAKGDDDGPERCDYIGECLDLFREYFFSLWD